MTPDELERSLMDFDPQVRCEALDALVTLWRMGRISCAPESDLVNMHCHTFFSYNGYGHSPSSLAWLARKRGWRALGTVDFDVLDGVEETLSACDRVQVRGASGLETRVFLPAYPDWEFNSPGEPGVLYYVGIGFVNPQAPPEASPVLQDMRERAAQRNRDMLERINGYLAPVTIDYARDVLPLTPSGNATERHILIAYDIAARRHFPERKDLVAFWAGKLDMDVAQVDAFLGETPFPHDPIRAKLMKRGGVGYQQPGPDTFPPLDAVNDAILACDAIPSYAFLDGLSEGESHMEELLELLIGKGMGALTIIPDRNWNVKDPDERALKVRKLDEVMALARALELPVIVGTEMNKPGQRLIDDFGAEPLRPYRQDFVEGAEFLYGHTLMQRALGRGYHSAWAREHLATREARNAFYIGVGHMAAVGPDVVGRAAGLEHIDDPLRFLARLPR